MKKSPLSPVILITLPNAGIQELLERLDRDEFDFVAVGRTLIVNPKWPEVIAKGDVSALLLFRRGSLTELV